MGTAVFAAGSTTDPEIPGEVIKPSEEVKELTYGQAKDKDGNAFTVMSTEDLKDEVKEILKDDEKVRDILEDAGYLPKDDEEIVVIGAGNLELDGKMPEGGVDVSLYVGTDADLKDGSTVYVLHQKHDGTWEVLEGKVTVDKYGDVSVTAHFDSLSPVAIIKVMSDGKAVIMDKDETKMQTIKTPSQNDKKSDAKLSPKTGK